MVDSAAEMLKTKRKKKENIENLYHSISATIASFLDGKPAAPLMQFLSSSPSTDDEVVRLEFFVGIFYDIKK